MKDLHSVSQTIRVIDPAAVGTTGVGKVGKIVDRAGFGGVEFIIAVGSITATNATIVATVKEGDATGALTSVADADLLGTEVLAGVAQAASRTSGTSKNVTRRIGYKGDKRYVNLTLWGTVTAGPVVSAVGLVHSPALSATPNP